MIQGMDQFVVALVAAQKLDRAVRDDLVRVHIRRCARAALEDIRYELVLQLARGNLIAGRGNRVSNRGVDMPGPEVRERAGFLDFRQRSYELRMELQAGKAEVQVRAQRVDAVVGLRGDFQLSQKSCSTLMLMHPL